MSLFLIFVWLPAAAAAAVSSNLGCVVSFSPFFSFKGVIQLETERRRHFACQSVSTSVTPSFVVDIISPLSLSLVLIYFLQNGRKFCELQMFRFSFPCFCSKTQNWALAPLLCVCLVLFCIIHRLPFFCLFLFLVPNVFVRFSSLQYLQADAFFTVIELFGRLKINSLRSTTTFKSSFSTSLDFGIPPIVTSLLMPHVTFLDADQCFPNV